MPTVYQEFDVTLTNGASGDFRALGSDSNAYPPVFVSGGTFNGHQITGTSTFGNPLNRLTDTTYFATSRPPDDIYAGTGSIIGIEGHISDPSYSNGISLALDDGTSVHIFVVGSASAGYSLKYETSDGGSGSLEASYVRTYYNTACFLAGAHILTDCGSVAVEALTVSDRVVTHAGELRPVRWIGQALVRPSRAPDPREAHPIRVRAHAIAENVPARDLRVSPGHALLLGDVLINAGELVNGGTIVQEEADVVHYYHVELDSHDILVADGMPCESYLDDGNRASFLNGADHIRLHGRIDRASEATCRPLVKEGPLLVAARETLLARALATGWVLAEAPALRIEADGALLAPVATVGRLCWFALPDRCDGAATLRLRSAAAIVNRIAPERADGRRLGVAIGALRVDGDAIDLAAESFGAGFHPLEDDGHARWRWTDGDATLHLPAGARMIELRLQIVLPTLCRGDAALAADEHPPLPAMPAHAGIP